MEDVFERNTSIKKIHMHSSKLNLKLIKNNNKFIRTTPSKEREWQSLLSLFSIRYTIHASKNKILNLALKY